MQSSLVKHADSNIFRILSQKKKKRKKKEKKTKKSENFQMKNSGSFHISALNVDCGYLLEPPWQGGSNEYPQSMFLRRNKKINI